MTNEQLSALIGFIMHRLEVETVALSKQLPEDLPKVQASPYFDEQVFECLEGLYEFHRYLWKVRRDLVAKRPGQPYVKHGATKAMYTDKAVWLDK